MIVIPAKELEDGAYRHANEAIRLDSQGARGMAIQMYQKAISSLVRLAKLYPDYKLNRLYVERAQAYQERVKALQTTHGLPPSSHSSPEPDVLSNEHGNGHANVVQSLKASYEDLVIKEKPNVKWDEVIGLEDAKKGIRSSIVFPLQRPDLFPPELSWPKGGLLYGPPGCGKTLLAAAAASDIDAYFISVDAASIMSKWLGEAEKNVAKIFSSARKLLEKDGAAVIIFVDELDSLLGSRNREVGGEVRVRNQFLKEMDGVADKGKNSHLFVLGATNKPWSLDWPFLRRFQKRIFVNLPDLDARTKMLKLYARPLKLSSNVKLDEIARLMEGYSGSDMRDVCQGVQLRAVSELFDTGHGLDESSQPREILHSDFKEILKSRRPSVAPEMIRAYASWSENYKAL